MSLADFRGRIPEHKRKSATVDLSETVDGLIIEFREPTLSQMADAASNSKKIRINHPDLTEDAAYHVLLFAEVHIAPQSDSANETQGFYADIATKNEPMFAMIRHGFYSEFDWLSNLIQSAADKKKT